MRKFLYLVLALIITLIVVSCTPQKYIAEEKDPITIDESIEYNI